MGYLQNQILRGRQPAQLYATLKAIYGEWGPCIKKRITSLLFLMLNLIIYE